MKKEGPNGFLVYMGDEKLPSYVRIIISHNYKGPYEPTSIVESRRVFCVAHLITWFFEG